jgi:hypothetical protein
MSAGCLCATISYAQAQRSPLCDETESCEETNGLFLHSGAGSMILEDLSTLEETEKELARLGARSPAPGHETVPFCDRLVAFDFAERFSFVMMPIFLF